MFGLFCEFSPLVRQAFVLLLYRRMAISQPLTFIRSRAVFVEAGAILFETQLIRVVIHGLTLRFTPVSSSIAGSCMLLCDPPHTK